MPDVVNGSLWTLRLEFTCYAGIAALGAARIRRGWAVGTLAAAATAAALLFVVLPDLTSGGLLRLISLAFTMPLADSLMVLG